MTAFAANTNLKITRGALQRRHLLNHTVLQVLMARTAQDYTMAHTAHAIQGATLAVDGMLTALAVTN